MFRKITVGIFCLSLLLGACSPAAPPLESAPSAQPESSSGKSVDEQQTDDEYDWFYVPAMTNEQQNYYAEYLRPLIFNGMLMLDWSIEEYSNISTAPSGANNSNNLIMAFEDIVGQTEMQKLWEVHEENLPAEAVETVLLERFPFTQEQLHEILYACYNPKTNVYTYAGGRGGGPIEGAVTAIKADGEFVFVSYELFTGYSGLDEEPASYLYKISGTLTLKQTESAYQYWSVKLDDNVEAQAKRDVALRE